MPTNSTQSDNLKRILDNFFANIVGYYQVSPSTHLKPKKTLRMILNEPHEEILKLVEKAEQEAAGNRCTVCKSPLVSAYCSEHEPVWIVRVAYKLSDYWDRTRLLFSGFRSFDPDSSELDQYIEEQKLEELEEKRKKK